MNTPALKFPRAARMRRCWLLPAAALAIQAANGFANDRDWPSVVPASALDVPMRDAAIVRGPDGSYYLTGTLAAESGARREPPDLRPTRLATAGSKHPDFDNCRVIKLWRSKDLKNWLDLGVVWDLARDVFGPDGDANHERVKWMRSTRYSNDPRGGEVNLGITEPELHYIQGGWYLCFSMNNRGTGLLKSKTGKPEGPYACVGRITAMGGSPSMFEDDDGVVYWLMDGGWIARMKDGLTGLAEAPRLIRPANDRPPDWMAEKGAEIFPDHPRSVGEHGAFLFKNRGRYYLTAGEWTRRLGTPCDDTYIAYADSLGGPWSARHLMVPHGGGVTVFQGPRNSAVPKYSYPQRAFFAKSVSKLAKPLAEVEKAKEDAPFYATFFGNDGNAILRDRPAFLPLEWTGPERPAPLLWADCESYPRKPQHVITERGPWARMRPFLGGLSIRDVHVRKMPDGHLYLSGSIIGKPKELFVYRTKDMLTWEEIGPLWTYDQIEWIPEKLPMPDLKPGETPWQHVFWDTQVIHGNGTFYIAFDIFMREDHPEHRGCGVLKSASGKIEGPYVSLGKVGGQLGQDSGPIMPNFFHGPDGQLYAKNWLDWKQVVAKADLETPGWKWDYKPVDGGIYKHIPRMDPFGIEGVDGKILFTTAGNGPESRPWPAWSDEYSYDVNYVTAATPWGPVVSEKMRTIPHAAAANCFQDFEGAWWRVFFGSDGTSAWNDQLGFLPLELEHDGNELIVRVPEPKELDERRLRIIGGGKVAEIRTVQETLKP